MKKLLLLCCLISSNVFALSAEDIVGFWYMPENKNGQIPVAEIFEKDGKFYAIGFAFQSLSENKTTDINNPDPTLRTRLIRNTMIINELEISNNALAHGEIYNPENGKYYYLKGSLSKNKDEISWRPSVDKTGLFGGGFSWKKVTNPNRYNSFRFTRKELESLIPTKRHKK